MSYKANDGYSAIQTNIGIDGYSFTLRAQTSNANNSNGGDFIIGSGSGVGSGTSRDGYVRLFSNLINEVARVSGNKFSQLLGQRMRVDVITTTPFSVTDGYYALLVNTSGGAKTLNLPVAPTKGDAYNVKDMTGNAAANNITVSGSGNNIDGSVSYVINTNFASSIFCFNGTTWSVL